MKQKINMKLGLLYMSFYTFLYVISFMYTSYLADLGHDSARISLLLSVSNICLLAYKPILAYLGDRGIFRKTVLGCLALILGSSVIMFGNSDHSLFRVVIYGVIAAALCRGLMDVMDAWVIRLSKADPAVDYGKDRSFGSFAYATIGLVYGYLLKVFSNRIILPVILVTGAFFLFAVLPVPDPSAVQAKKQSSYRELWTNRSFRILLAFDMLVGPISFIIDNFVPILIRDVGGGSFETGLSSFVMCVIEFFVFQRITVLLKAHGKERLLAMGMAGFGIKAILIALMKDPVWMIAACVSQTLSFCLYQPAKIEFIKEEIPEQQVSSALSFLSFMSNIVLSVFISPLAGFIASAHSDALVFYVYGLIAILAGIVFYRLIKKADQ